MNLSLLFILSQEIKRARISWLQAVKFWHLACKLKTKLLIQKGTLWKKLSEWADILWVFMKCKIKPLVKISGTNHMRTETYFFWVKRGCSIINVPSKRWFNFVSLVVQSSRHLSSSVVKSRRLKSTIQSRKHRSVVLLYISRNSLNWK